MWQACQYCKKLVFIDCHIQCQTYYLHNNVRSSPVSMCRVGLICIMLMHNLQSLNGHDVSNILLLVYNNICRLADHLLPVMKIQVDHWYKCFSLVPTDNVDPFEWELTCCLCRIEGQPHVVSHLSFDFRTTQVSILTSSCDGPAPLSCWVCKECMPILLTWCWHTCGQWEDYQMSQLTNCT